MKNFNIKIFSLVAALLYIIPACFALADNTDSVSYVRTAGSATYTSGSNVYFGQYSSGYNSELAIKYIAPDSHAMCNITLYLRKQGSPTDNLYVQVQQGSLTDLAPQGAVFGTSGTTVGSTLPTSSYEPRTFNFDNCLVLTGNYVYWIAIKRDGTYADANYYGLHTENTSVAGDTSCFNCVADGVYYRLASNHTDGSGNWAAPSPYPGPLAYYEINGIYSSNSFPSPGDFNGVQSGCQQGSITYYICTALSYVFIPSGGFTAAFDDLKEQVETTANARVPFVYFESLGNSIQSLDTDDNRGYLIDASIPISGPTGDVTLPIHAFNTAVGSDEIKSFDYVRPYINMFLWISFAFYAGTRVFRLFKPV